MIEMENIPRNSEDSEEIRRKIKFNSGIFRKTGLTVRQFSRASFYFMERERAATLREMIPQIDTLWGRNSYSSFNRGIVPQYVSWQTKKHIQQEVQQTAWSDVYSRTKTCEFIGRWGDMNNEEQCGIELNSPGRTDIVYPLAIGHWYGMESARIIGLSVATTTLVHLTNAQTENK